MRSDTIKRGFERSPHRSLLKATGNFTDADQDKPFIAIACSHVDIIPGHAHLDTAWLWPVAETWRKAQRTFTTQLALMRDYPEHRFACSQAVHYEWIRERDPGLWARIREQVAAGRFVPVGGSWVEPDCNLPPARRCSARGSSPRRGTRSRPRRASQPSHPSRSRRRYR